MDEQLSQLITEIVNTRAKLDILAYFHRNPYAWESLDGLSQRLYRAVSDLEPAVSTLSRTGLIEARRGGRGGTETVYSYQRGHPLAQSLDRLLTDYEGPASREIVTAVARADRASRARALSQKRVLDDLKTRFISMVTHELRTPVTALRSIHSTLLGPGCTSPEQTRQLLERAMSQCDRLTALVENLLVLSGLHTGGDFELYLSEVDLPRLIEEVVRQHRRGEGTPAIVADIESAPPTLVADEYLIAQVLAELIDNALKFSPTEGTITVRAWHEDADVVFTVADQGAGVPARDRERIFEEFYQTEEDSSQRVSGLGLGLFMARRIVERHGGRIWVVPNEEPGLTISFILPRQGPAQEE